MTLKDFSEHYYLHDSCITKIEYIDNNLLFYIDFCYWMQDWYIEGDPDLMKIIVMFKGVDEYDGILGYIDYYSIIDFDINNHTLNILDDYNNQFYHYDIHPKNVEVKILNKFHS